MKKLLVFCLVLALMVPTFAVIYAGEGEIDTMDSGISMIPTEWGDGEWVTTGVKKGGDTVGTIKIPGTTTAPSGNTSVVVEVKKPVDVVDKEETPVTQDPVPDVPVQPAPKKMNPYPPSIPKVLRNEGTTVYLQPLENGEYSLDMETWQDDPVFTGLTVDTRYYIYQRYKETETVRASAPSDPLTIILQSEPEENTDTEPVYTPVNPDKEIGAAYQMTVDGKKLWLDMTEEELLNNMGCSEPDEKLNSTWDNLTWYVFVEDGYTGIVVAGVNDSGIVASLFAEGKDWSWNGVSSFKTYKKTPVLSAEDKRELKFVLYNEPSLTNQPYAFRMHWIMAHSSLTFSKENLEDECRLIFLLTNVYRVMNGQKPQEWCGLAEKAALEHSTNMAQQNFFGHMDKERRLVIHRLNSHGIYPRSSAENIAGGQTDAVEAFTAWVKSPGHRNNLLFANPEKTGVACSTRTGSTYFIYWTQVFYQQ